MSRVGSSLTYFIMAMFLISCSAPATTNGADDSVFFNSVGPAKQQVANLLKDPDSAEYRGVRGYKFKASDGGMAYTFCGDMNAKNGFGGYDGYTRFIAYPSGALIERDDTDTFQTFWSKSCQGQERDAPAF